MKDFCFVINGNNSLNIMVPLFFETLVRCNDVSDYCIHAIIKDVDTSGVAIDPKIVDYIEGQKNTCPTELIVHHLDPFILERGPDRQLTPCIHTDVALTAEWAMNNCGDSDWVVLSHFDIFFKKDVLSFMSSQIQHDTGVVGRHAYGIMFINREAFRQSFVGFRTMAGFHLVLDPGKVGGEFYKVRINKDGTVDGKKLIEGFDCFELFELSLGTIWFNAVCTDIAIFKEYTGHLIQGSGYHNNQATANMQRDNMRRMANLYKTTIL